MQFDLFQSHMQSLKNILGLKREWGPQKIDGPEKKLWQNIFWGAKIFLFITYQKLKKLNKNWQMLVPVTTCDLSQLTSLSQS